MPWTIYFYILKELLKLLFLATMVLVTVISFGLAIKPLSEGLLGPVAMSKFIFYTTPTTLQFALPFAGAFASTMVFSRMVSDNEILACSAGGMSYRSILLPVTVLGLVMMLGMFYLSNWVVPTFYQRAASAVERDVVRIMVSQLTKGRAVSLGPRWTIYADTAQERPLTAQDIADFPDLTMAMEPRWIGLQGVAAIERDAQGMLLGDATAQRADVLIYRDPDRDQTWATINLHVGMRYEIGQTVDQDGSPRGGLIYTQDLAIPPQQLPSTMRDHPQFLSLPRLRQLRNKPESYDRIFQAKQALAEALAEAMLREKVIDSLGARSGVELRGSRGERLRLRAPRLTQPQGRIELMAEPGDPVVFEQIEAGLVKRRLEAKQGRVEVRSDDGHLDPQVVVELNQVRVIDPESGNVLTEHVRVMLPRGTWPQPLLSPLMAMSVDSLQREALGRYMDDGPAVQSALMVNLLQDGLSNKIRALLHQRAVAATSALLLLVLGAVLAIWLRHRMVLVLYGVTFLAAMAAIVTSQSGGTLASRTDSAMLGVGVIWLSTLPPLLLLAWGWVRLNRT